MTRLDPVVRYAVFAPPGCKVLGGLILITPHKNAIDATVMAGSLIGSHWPEMKAEGWKVEPVEVPVISVSCCECEEFIVGTREQVVAAGWTLVFPLCDLSASEMEEGEPWYTHSGSCPEHPEPDLEELVPAPKQKELFS